MIHPQWTNFSQSIDEYITKFGIENFYQCQTIKDTMFGGGEYTASQIRYLKTRCEEHALYHLLEDMAKPAYTPSFYHGTSNDVHQLNHIFHFTEFFILPNRVLEFGGGYGCMSKILSRLSCNVTIYDLPVLQKIQEYYTKINKVNVSWTKTCEMDTDLFVAMWSLSETPLDFRKQILEQVNTKYYFVAFGQEFFDISNHELYNTLRDRCSKHYLVECSHSKNQYYFIGAV